MKEVIELLLQKKSVLEADREAEKEMACQEIDAKYAEREEKIINLLDMAGYVAPVEEVADEVVSDDLAEAEAVEEVASAEASNVININV